MIHGRDPEGGAILAAVAKPGASGAAARADRAGDGIAEGRLPARHDAAAALRLLRMKNPIHPGGFVKSEIIEPLACR